MRIALLSDTYPPENRGGAGVVVERLALDFLRRGHTPLVIATSPNQTYDTDQSGVHVRRLRSHYPERFRNTMAMANPMVLAGVGDALREFRPDLVHAHNIHQQLSFASLRVASKLNVPIAYTAHDYLLFCCIKFICTNGSVDFRQRWFNCAKCQRFRWNPLRNSVIRKRLEGHVDHLFAISRALQTALRANGYGSAEVVHNGVDPEWWAAGDSERFRTKFSLGDEPIVLLAARVGREKGAEAAVRALARTRNTTARLVIAGDNPRYVPELQRLANQLGLASRLLLPGWLTPPDLRDAYRAAAVTIAPSTYPDPFNLTLIESMAAGTPVIASAFGAGPELVPDGQTGYVIQPDDAIGFADRLDLLLGDSGHADALGCAGRKHVRQRFTLAQQTDRTLARYEALLDRHV